MPKEKPATFKLPEDVRTRLANLEEDVAKTKAAIETLKKIGIDVTEIEEKLKWAEETRQILLKEFA